MPTKKYRKPLLIMVLFCCFCLSTNAQSPGEYPSLVGEWILNFDKSWLTISEDGRAMFDSLDEEKQESMKVNYKNKSLIITEGSQFELIQNNSVVSSGSWEIVLYEGADYLVLNGDSGGQKSFKIIDVTTTGLELGVVSPKGMTSLLKKWVFNK